MRQLNVLSAPYIAILTFNRGARPEAVGSRSGNDITLDSLIEMIDLTQHMEPQRVQTTDFPPLGGSEPMIDTPIA
jgi:hypothetical protein